MPTIPYTRVTFSGVFGSTALPTEIWSFNVNAGPLIVPAVEDLGEAAVLAHESWRANLMPRYRSDTILTRVRVAQIGADGRVSRGDQDAYRQGDDTRNSPGTSTQTTSPKLPLQTALVVSLQSARPGASGKGRFYLPWPAYALADDYRLQQVHADEMRTSVKAFLLGVRGAMVEGGAAPLVVASSKGYNSPVTSLAVGRAPDTMRSRRNALIDGRLYTAL